jgi:hypothetical protein
MSKLRAWWQNRQWSRYVSNGIAGLSTRVRRVEARLDRRRKYVEEFKASVRAVGDSLDEEREVVTADLAYVMRQLGELQKAQKQYENQMEALRSQAKIAEEVTIPSLVAAHKLVLERVDADTAIQIKKQVAQQ